jgi:hypothetical protein
LRPGRKKPRTDSEKSIRGCPILPTNRRPSSPRRPTNKGSGRSSDSRLSRPPRLPGKSQWPEAAFVPGYSGGPVPDLHRIPVLSSQAST